ncbi:MAG: type II toxin-antitoxin system RelE/ParE family toxin [Methylovirgula sp.]
MKHNVVRTPRARRDLIEIWEFIAKDNEQAANKVLDRIEDVLQMLSDNPKAGRLRPELTGDLRSFPIGTYILFYLPIESGVELVRVLSGHLDIRTDDVT